MVSNNSRKYGAGADLMNPPCFVFALRSSDLLGKKGARHRPGLKRSAGGKNLFTAKLSGPRDLNENRYFCRSRLAITALACG